MLSPKTMAVKNKEGLTAVQIAKRRGNRKLIDFLTAEANRAIDHFTRAIEAGGPYTFTYFERRGSAHQALGDADKAEADFEEADRRRAAELRRGEDTGDDDAAAGSQDVSGDDQSSEERPNAPTAPSTPEDDTAALLDAA